jgi:hypothetical protein
LKKKKKEKAVGVRKSQGKRRKELQGKNHMRNYLHQ